jgi:hypothetical protein
MSNTYNQSKNDKVELVKKQEWERGKAKEADELSLVLQETTGLLSLKPRLPRTLQTRLAADISSSKLC